MPTAIVDSFVASIADAAEDVARRSDAKPLARKLLNLLADKRRLLVSTHVHPDPDAIASSLGLAHLLRATLPDATVDLSIKGPMTGGVNAAFAELSDLDLTPWPDEAALASYDAILLTDVQPTFPYSPLPAGVEPFAVIDHHRTRGRRQAVPFCDVRTDVGASASIVFSYLTECEVDVPPGLAATMLYGIESDLAGAAGHPGELDALALSQLTLVADSKRLYQMRYAPLPRAFYLDFARGIGQATHAGGVLATHLGEIRNPEMPAVVADFLLRYEGTQWVLVSAVHAEGRRLVLSLRTNDARVSAGERMRRILRHDGQGGGHRTKAGGFVPLATGTAAEVAKWRRTLRRRLAKAVGLPADVRFQRLVDAC